jgi:hypothetical protein
MESNKHPRYITYGKKIVVTSTKLFGEENLWMNDVSTEDIIN